MHIEKCGNIFTKKKRRAKSFFCIVLFSFAVILKFGYYRFSYFPILDDYIQYGAYHLYDKSYVLFQIGTIFTRPLAAICDLYIWGLFKDNLSIAFVIITAMHILSAFLFKRAFGKAGIHLGNLFLIFYLLSPILSEAVYWISASSRIVPGLLFCSISINFLCEYLERKKLHLWMLAFLTHFISYGFYEQTMCLSFAVFVFLIFAKGNCEKKARFYSLIIPSICAIFYVAYYFIFRDMENLSHRGGILLSFPDMFSTAKRIIRIATLQNFELTLNGFIRGIRLLDRTPIYILLTILVSGAFIFLPKERSDNGAKKLILSAVILLMSYLPYFIISESYPEFRSMYTFIFAFGVLIDCIGDKFNIKSILCAVLAFIFITANVSETHDFKAVYDKDRQIINEIVVSGKLSEKSDMYVTGVKEYYTNVNSRLGAHISNITSSDWALTGAVINHTKNPNIKKLIPVFDGGESFTNKIDISHIK